MDVREKLVELLNEVQETGVNEIPAGFGCTREYVKNENVAAHLIAHGVTVQECAEWVHPKGYVVSNGFLCSNCGHEEASYYPINPRPGGGCIADENGNFYHSPKINYCPNCGAKMMPKPPKGE